MITFRIPAVPVAWPKPYAVSMGGKARLIEAPSKVKSTGQPHPIHAFKASVRNAAAEAYSGPPLEGPLLAELSFVLPRPNKRDGRKHKGDGRYFHHKKPDVDNLQKAIFDALNGLTYKDDAQIAIVNATKTVASAHEQPHVTVTVRKLED